MVRNSSAYPKKWRLISKQTRKKRGNKCEDCGIPESKKVPLQVDHIDGNKKNCGDKNLKVRCPACHLKKGIKAGEIKPYILKNISKTKRRFKK